MSDLTTETPPATDSAVEPTVGFAEATTAETSPNPTPKRRSLPKRAMHLIRRGHLYLGLFLFPWAVLYGVTGFLFNHPTAFSDEPMITVESEHLDGTPLESPPSPEDTAALVVAALQEREEDGATYTLVQPDEAEYTRDFAFASVRTDDQNISVLLNVDGSGGRVRVSEATVEEPNEKPAPFAVGATGNARGGRGGRGGSGRRGPSGSPDRLEIDQPMAERVKAAVPTVLEKHGLPSDKDVTVTSVPDLSFLMDVDGEIWRVTYNALNGTVSGKRLAEEEPNTISVRRFLTRLHLSHGYPSSMTTRWAWAVIVDAMAFVMVFWGVSGLLMWFQIKATRKLGLLILLLSAVAATFLAMGMHEALTS